MYVRRVVGHRAGPGGNEMSAKNAVTLRGWKFERVSGAYIDITPPGAAHAVEVINCWDYAAGASEVPFTKAATRAAAVAWFEDHAEDLDAYLEHARYAS